MGGDVNCIAFYDDLSFTAVFFLQNCLPVLLVFKVHKFQNKEKQYSFK